VRTSFKVAAALLLLMSLVCRAEIAASASAELAPDKELLARIEALPDNTWLKLPPVKTSGDMGVLNNDPDYKRLGPRVRDYCNKMVWAPDRQRALYCGGGHNIHPFNDVWEYDLASNTWLCVYGADPVPPRTKQGEEDKMVDWYKQHAVLKDGSVRTPHGAPVRPCHTWWSLAYDSDRRQLLFLESHKGFFGVDKPLLAKALNIDPKDPLLGTFGSGPGEAWLFTFDPNKREWNDVLTKVPKAYESSCMEYLPDSKTIWWNSGKTYRLNPPAKEWTPCPASKNTPPAGGETAYDPESRKVVATVGQKTWAFSCDDNSWTLLQENATDGGVVPLSTFCYDSVARKFVLYTQLKLADGTAEPRLRLYDLKENKWSDPAPQGEQPKLPGVAGYYDPARNVTVLYSNAQTWVYRCKRNAGPAGK
jgi:hypothetical protein